MFDPIHASEEIKKSYIDYITTTFDISDEGYASQLRQQLMQEGAVAKGPYLDIGGSFESGHTLDELMAAGEACSLFAQLEPVAEKERELKLHRPLYLHQENALLKASKGQNLVVTTGTGSGKTESFLIPVINHILGEIENGQLGAGVRAIIVYPMNALANDQIKRMRALLKNYSAITFGIYNGNTLHSQSDALSEYRKTHKDANGQPLSPLPNELISRERMQETPPHILITNYSMLEYMMLRPKDDAVFSGAKLRYIILDEAHIYKGATGMETSMLMRRLRARISEPDAVQYILTSATLGGEDADDEILSFAEKLTGVHFTADGIIRSKEKSPIMEDYLSVNPEIFVRLNSSPENVGTILSENGLDFCPDGPAEEKLYHLCLHTALFAALRNAAKGPITVSQLREKLKNASPEISNAQVTAFIDVCARAELNGACLIKPRYHFFVRALEGAYITLAGEKQLFLTRQTQYTSPAGENFNVFEAAICSDCGRLGIVGRREGGRLVQSARRGAKDDAEYYLLKQASDGELFDDEEVEHDDDESTDENDYVLCPVCGAIGGEGDLAYTSLCEHDKSAYLKIRYIEPGNTGRHKCPACGFGHMSRFYLGAEAATAVLGTELYEQLPAEIVTEAVSAEKPKASLFSRSGQKKARTQKARQFLCFSDSRSEAAYFATYMERSYQEFLRRRGIWHTVETLKSRGQSRVSVTDFVNELARYFEENRSFSEWDSGNIGHTSVSRQNAWIAILNEMFNARRTTSLVSLGMMAFAYRRNEGLEEGFAEEYPQLTESDAGALLEQLVQDAIFTGALNAGRELSLTEADREYIFFTPYEKKLVKTKTASGKKHTHHSGWCGRRRTNGKGGFYPNARISRLVRALDITPEKADSTLGDYWDNIFSPETETFVLDANDFDILLGGTAAVSFYRCRKCGKITPYNVRGKCASVKCDGLLEEIDPTAENKDNHYANLYMSEQMHPLFIKEHTAQLAKDQQTKYQEAFVNRKINALSCSTTFEMGVDVGSLETVYMRDVPPSPANYVQRAGRAGRGKGSAAFVMTYAKLSSHDFTYYDEPEKMISGKISAPIFEVENEKILYRHVFAVALSAFFSSNDDVYAGDDQTVLLNEGGYERLKEFLDARPAFLRELLKKSIPADMHGKLGIDDWSWVDHLCGENGLLQLAVDDFRNQVAEFEKNRLAAREANDDEAAGEWKHTLRNFRCAKEDNVGRKSLISFLVRNNILPKYGFPVDTVELFATANARGGDKDLQLARDLQMAIADYAPGAQVVADGKLYTSRYIKKSPGKNAGLSWEIGYYCPKCTICGQPNFTKEPIVKSRECVSCRTRIPKARWFKTLEPRLGFVADVSKKDEPVPMHRPEHDYKTDDVYIGDRQRNVLSEQEFCINDAVVKIASTTNDSLVVVGQSDFSVCPTCGYASQDGIPANHKNMFGYPCSNTAGTAKEHRLSHDFKTDVARITFVDKAAGDYNTMISVLYALLEGLSREMGIERTDIKGCLFRTAEEGFMLYSVVLYDAVAGGAGHVRRIVTDDGAAFLRVLKRALAVVSGCTCGSSCYHCLRNYYNQKIHDQLSRHKAAEFLSRWIGEIQHNTPVEPAAVPEHAAPAGSADSEINLDDDFGTNMKDTKWSEIWSNLSKYADDTDDKVFLNSLADNAQVFYGKEKPYFDCNFMLGDTDCTCDLLWVKSKTMFFTAENEEYYEAVKNTSWTCIKSADNSLNAEKIAEKLMEG